jgi:hypothetical protein
MLFGSVNQRLAVVVRKESGSDGTRTRDLRRDKPVRRVTTIGDD